VDRHTVTIATDWEALRRFAKALHDEMGATRVLLFGSRARGQERRDSDCDLIVVSPRFAQISRLKRELGLRDIWYRVGGDGPVDFICLTQDEFDAASHRISLIQAVLPEAIDLLPRDEDVRLD
jgi:predicted nucleotidyltransferase